MSWLFNKIIGGNTTTTENNENQNVQTETAPAPQVNEAAEPSGFGSILKTLLSAASLGSDVLAAGISLPCSMYEPLSILMRQTEMLEYCSLLDIAAECENTIDRLAYVAAFATSGYSSTERYYTDFNPILGETFEYYDEETGMRYLTEQVSHHPPISAVHAEGNSWVFWQTCSASTSFQGNSIEIYTDNTQSHIYFPNTKDHFSYTNPKCCVHNLIIGKMWIEHFGTLHITNVKTAEECTIEFKKGTFFGGTNYRVQGHIKTAKGRKVINLEGEWNQYLNGTWIASGEERSLWNVTPDNNLPNKYNYTRFTEKLLRVDDELKAILPPTDSRFRCDRVLLEKNDTSRATRIKRVMEDKQREDKKRRIAEGEEWTPMYFHPIPDEQGGDVWVYSGDYWDQRNLKVEALKDGNLEEAQKYLNGGTSAGSACDFPAYEQI
jgi:hypothetical protein